MTVGGIYGYHARDCSLLLFVLIVHIFVIMSMEFFCNVLGPGRRLNFKSRNLQPEVLLCPESHPYGTPWRGNGPANRRAPSSPGQSEEPDGENTPVRGRNWEIKRENGQPPKMVCSQTGISAPKNKITQQNCFPVFRLNDWKIDKQRV